MGDHMREKYSALGKIALRTALASRLKAVLVSDWVARTWIDEYGSAILKRPAAQSRVLKRPSTAEQPALKRPRIEPAAAVESITLNSAECIEASCGERYRTDVMCLFSAMRLRSRSKFYSGHLLGYEFPLRAEKCSSAKANYELVEFKTSAPFAFATEHFSAPTGNSYPSKCPE